MNPSDWPGYQVGDYVIKDYKFASGETLPELTLHYRTIGTAQKNSKGEIINGVHVHRVPSTGFGRNRLLGRSIDYVSFYRSMWQCLVALARPGDIIVAKTDPPVGDWIGVERAMPGRQCLGRKISPLRERRDICASRARDGGHARLSRSARLRRRGAARGW